MIDIRKIIKYYKLSLEDKVIAIRCFIDPEHPILVPKLELDDDYNDIIYLYCIDCDFKLYPGEELYKNIEFVLEEMEVNGED